MSGRGKLWTAKEDAIVRRLYPDYKALVRTLRGRSYWAIRSRARALGVVKRRHTWTAAEVSRLRKHAAAGLTRRQVIQQFSGLQAGQIIGAMQHHRIRTPRLALAPTGDPLLDEVRKRCLRMGITMPDLDEIAKTKRYFQKQNWRSVKMRRANVAKAIYALDGELTVRWLS